MTRSRNTTARRRSRYRAALRAIQADVKPVEADARLPWRLAEEQFDFAFNMAEGQGRRCRKAVRQRAANSWAFRLPDPMR